MYLIMWRTNHLTWFRFWRTYNDQSLVAEQQKAQLASLRSAYSAGLVTLEKLERTNVYNDAFCIGHDGVFGTINGLRLGRVPGVPVRVFSSTGIILWAHDLGFRWNGRKSTPHGVKHSCFYIPSLAS